VLCYDFAPNNMCRDAAPWSYVYVGKFQQQIYRNILSTAVVETLTISVNYLYYFIRDVLLK